MGDVMFFGILRMPYEMAMETETNRFQYWQTGQEAANEIERLRGALKEILTHETDYEPYDCIEIARAALKGDE